MAGVNDINLFVKPDYPGTNDIKLGRTPTVLHNFSVTFTNENVFTVGMTGHAGGFVPRAPHRLILRRRLMGSRRR